MSGFTELSNLALIKTLRQAFGGETGSTSDNIGPTSLSLTSTPANCSIEPILALIFVVPASKAVEVTPYVGND